MEKIKIFQYEPKNRSEWEDFVDKSNNGTMFHKQAFLDYHPPNKFGFHHLMFRSGEKLIGVLPGGLSDNGKTFWSPMGASYGSIVTEDTQFSQSLEMIDILLGYSREMKFNDLYLIPPPIIYNKFYNQHLEYAMLYRRFEFEYSYISHSIDLKIGDNFLNFFDKTARKTIRKILRKKEIIIKESDDFESFNEILIENKARHNIKPTHTLEDMLKLKKLLPESIKLFLVYYENKPIAGSLLFLCNEKVVLCFYNMLLYEYEKFKPIYLIMYETTQWAIENGYDWIDIGVSQDTKAEDPMTPSMNLIYFKERFHSRGILRNTYHFRHNY